MQLAKLSSFIAAMLLLTVVFAGLVTVSATAAQMNTAPLVTKNSDGSVNAQAGLKKVIFRDDDIEPWSPYLNTLKAVNKVHIDKNVPVTLAIIPHPYTTIYGNELLMDKPLLYYLQSTATNPLFEFAQHGYNHHDGGVGTFMAGGGVYPRSYVGAGEPSVYWRPTGEQIIGAQLVGSSEFRGRSYTDQYNAIKQGRDDLVNAFGVTPTTFVPPWDTGDVNTLMAAHAVGHTLYSTGGSDLSGVYVPGITVQSVSLEFPWESTVDWNTAIPSLISQTDALLNAAPNGASIVVLYHFWAFERSDGSVDPARIAWLEQYIDHLKGRGDVLFSTLHNQQVKPTQLSISTNNAAPTVNQQVTFTATLKRGTTPLPSKRVTIYHYLNGVKSTDTTKTTNANGQITFVQAFGSPGQRSYYATFAGDSTYGSSTSSVVKVNFGNGGTPTTFGLSAASQSVKPNAMVRLTGTGLPGQPVELWVKLGAGNWYKAATRTTGTGGVISWDVWSPDHVARAVQYYLLFQGTGTYAAAKSNVLTIKYENTKTTPYQTALYAYAPKPMVAKGTTNQMWVRLSNGNTPLTGKHVYVWKWSGGKWVSVSRIITRTGDQAGWAQTDYRWNYVGTGLYQFTFFGSSPYDRSTSNAVQLIWT